MVLHFTLSPFPHVLNDDDQSAPQAWRGLQEGMGPEHLPFSQPLPPSQGPLRCLPVPGPPASLPLASSRNLSPRTPGSVCREVGVGPSSPGWPFRAAAPEGSPSPETATGSPIRRWMGALLPACWFQVAGSGPEVALCPMQPWGPWSAGPAVGPSIISTPEGGPPFGSGQERHLAVLNYFTNACVCVAASEAQASAGS